MYVESRQSHKKSWQESRARVSVLADLAIRKETVVRKLTELRAAHDLTQERAAAKVGVTVRQWQRWEGGASVPYARNLSQVADAFGFDVGEFDDGQGPREPEKPAGVSTSDKLDMILANQAAMMDRLDAIEAMLVSGKDLIERLDSLQAAITEKQDALLPGVQEFLREAQATPRAARSRSGRT